MHITVSPAGRGRFDARLGDRLLCTSMTPFYAAARVLKAEGVLPQEPLTMSHEGSDVIALRGIVGEAANFTVEDTDRDGLRTRRYREFQSGPLARPV